MGLSVYLERECWVSYDKGKTHQVKKEEVFTRNTTHNLVPMAKAVGLYEPLWNPKTKVASELIEPLRIGLEKLRENPKEYKKFNPENGWGTYEGFIDFVEDYLHACIANPNAEVSVWK